MDQDVRRELNNLKAALIGASSALHQLRMYVVEGKKPTPQGVKLFDDYIAQIDRVVSPNTFRGWGTP